MITGNSSYSVGNAEYLILLDANMLMTGYRRLVIVNDKVAIEVKEFSITEILRSMSSIDQAYPLCDNTIIDIIEQVWNVLIDCNEYYSPNMIQRICKEQGVSIRFEKYTLQ